MALIIRRRASKRTGCVTWQVRIPEPSPDFPYATFDRKRDAEAYVAAWRASRTGGVRVRRDPVTLERWILDDYLPAVLSSKSRHTWEHYDDLLRRYVLPTLGERPLQSITTAELRTLYAELAGRGLAPATVRTVHAIVRSALATAVRRRLLAVSPSAGVTPRDDLPRNARRRPMRTLTADEAARFVAAVRGDRYEGAWLLALDSGMRPSEWSGLMLDAVDLAACTVSVRRSLHWRRGGRGPWRLDDTKTERSRRTIPVAAATAAALTRQLERRDRLRAELGERWPDLPFVFLDATGGPVRLSNLRTRDWLELLRRAGLATHDPTTDAWRPEISYYDLRHTCATLLLTAGVNPKVVADRLGHTSVVTTLDVYSHVLPSIQAEATDRLAAILYGASP